MTTLEIIERETGQKVTPQTPLEELDIDSLGFLDLMLTIGNETGHEVSDLTALRTVGDIMKAAQ